MGKDVDDQQGRQQDEGVGDPETVGRRFKPDLGHHHPSPGIASVAPDEQAGHGLVPVKPCTYHTLP